MGTTIKTNKILFYIANLLVIAPYVVKNYSLAGIGIAIGLLLFLLYRMLFKTEDNLSASAYLPSIVCTDFFIYVGVNFQLLKDNFNWNMIELFFTYLDNTCFWLIALGITLLFISICKEKFSWLFGFGTAFIGTSVVLTLWSSYQLGEIKFFAGGKAVLAIFFLGTILWSIVYQISVITAPYQRAANTWLGIILLLSVLILNIADYQFMKMISSEIETGLLALPDTVFAWWKVILFTVIAVIGALAMFQGEEKGIGIDSLVTFCSGVSVLCLKVLMSNYFSYSWILFFALSAGMFLCLKNEVNGKKTTLGIPNLDYILLLPIVFIVVVLLIKKGLWINVIISSVFLLLFHSKKDVFKKHSYNNIFFYLYILGLVLCETMAWMWKFRMYTNGMIMLGMIFAVTMIGIFITNIRHPNGIRVKRSVCQIMCACMTILCLLCMNKYGTRVDVLFQTNEQKAEIVLEARGKENTVETASYYWSDIKMNQIGNEKKLYAGTQKIEIEGEILTIIVVDSKGITTTRNEWYPKWLIEER